MTEISFPNFEISNICDILGNDLLKTYINSIRDMGLCIPNMILYGCCGVGKTSFIKGLVKDVQSSSPTSKSVYINCGDNRNIFSIRNMILNTLSDNNCFALPTCKKDNRVEKIILLDEVDTLLYSSQMFILSLMENYRFIEGRNISFILVCNDISKLCTELKRNVFTYQFENISNQCVKEWLKEKICQSSFYFAQKEDERTFYNHIIAESTSSEIIDIRKVVQIVEKILKTSVLKCYESNNILFTSQDIKRIPIDVTIRLADNEKSSHNETMDNLKRSIKHLLMNHFTCSSRNISSSNVCNHTYNNNDKKSLLFTDTLVEFITKNAEPSIESTMYLNASRRTNVQEDEGISFASEHAGVTKLKNFVDVFFDVARQEMTNAIEYKFAQRHDNATEKSEKDDILTSSFERFEVLFQKFNACGNEEIHFYYALHVVAEICYIFSRFQSVL